MTKEQAIERIHEALYEIECAVTDYPELLPLLERAYEALPIFEEGE
jgi:hypothetical protein